MQTTDTTPQTDQAQIPVDRLTAILDTANQAWRAVQTAEDPDDRLQAIRVHVRHVTAYLDALEKALD